MRKGRKIENIWITPWTIEKELYWFWVSSEFWYRSGKICALSQIYWMVISCIFVFPLLHINLFCHHILDTDSMQGTVLITDYPKMNKIFISFQGIYCLIMKKKVNTISIQENKHCGRNRKLKHSCSLGKNFQSLNKEGHWL